MAVNDNKERYDKLWNTHIDNQKFMDNISVVVGMGSIPVSLNLIDKITCSISLKVIFIIINVVSVLIILSQMAGAHYGMKYCELAIKINKYKDAKDNAKKKNKDTAQNLEAEVNSAQDDMQKIVAETKLKAFQEAIKNIENNPAEDEAYKSIVNEKNKAYKWQTLSQIGVKLCLVVILGLYIAAMIVFLYGRKETFHQKKEYIVDIMPDNVYVYDSEFTDCIIK